MQLCVEYIHEEQIKLYTVFHQQFEHFSDECQLHLAHSGFKQSVQNVHQRQLHTIQVCCKMIDCCKFNELLRQITPYHQQNGFSGCRF